jgi:putative colanic acid biosynthesis UDP-glucose lipid carrier transferase
MRNNNQSNELIKWLVIAGDFVVLNLLMSAFAKWHWQMADWGVGMKEVYILVNNIALMLSLSQFQTIVHLRVVGAGEMLRRVLGLVSLQSLLAYLLWKLFAYNVPVRWLVLEIGSLFVAILVIKRLIERWVVKLSREAGRNTRMVTLVGSNSELLAVKEKLANDATLGYKIINHFEQAEDFLSAIAASDNQFIGEELYLCISRKRKDIIQQISGICDSKLVRFYYVPVSVESIGLNLKRELMDDIEVFTTYENPLQSPVNRLVKRLFDIMLSIPLLALVALTFPVIWIIIKIQSPGPIIFKQERTGLDGESFKMYKFRSMHVNREADLKQALKDDPRKFPFGNLMRKTSIDELPQFWNVLKGDMSIVGPRPHMLAHTEMYAQLIKKYMVRHFVKPGITGWAQVKGYRGETKELWQMEGRVRRDIWYMENWSIWLDIRIVWLTFKSLFRHDENAY